MCYEYPTIASLSIGAAQEADLVSPGFEQSRAISNRSNLDFTLHCGEQRIVLPGDASWKQLCSSSVPPDDDDVTFDIRCITVAATKEEGQDNPQPQAEVDLTANEAIATKTVTDYVMYLLHGAFLWHSVSVWTS